MSSERSTKALLLMFTLHVITILLSLSTIVNTLQWSSSYRSLPSSLLPSSSERHTHHHKSSHSLQSSLPTPLKQSYRSVPRHQEHGHGSDHHHWSVDDWWTNVQDDDRRQSREISFSPRDFEAFVAINDDNDPLETAASEDQARIVEEPDNAKLKFDSRSVIVDINEHRDHRIENNNNHNKSSIISRRKSATGNDVWKTFTKFPKDKDDNDIPIKRGESEFYSPKTSISTLRFLFNEYFRTVRSNLPTYEGLFNEIKIRLEKRLQLLELPTKRQFFYPEYKTGKRKGQNLFAVYKGTNKTGNSNVIVLGAHYDTVPGSAGIEDNGSGSVAILEVARLLKSYRCKLDSTVYFVFFDMEEDGLIGSRAFVRDYLVPFEIEEAKSNIQGAFIIDMLLQYDDRPNKQHTNVLGKLVPEFADMCEKNENRANFAAVWARNDVPEDIALWNMMRKNWQNEHKYKLMPLKNPLPRYGQNLTQVIRSKEFKAYSTFLRSDHSNFWYPASEKERTIPAVLLTDLGPWREVSNKRYHTSLDNIQLLNRKNMEFLKNSIDSLVRTVLELGNGQCLDSLKSTTRQTKKLLKPNKIINASRRSQN